MTYPRPDRSGFTPNFTKSAENPAIDIGWAEGVLKDGRPYRMECWAEEQVTSVTVFFSSIGLEGLEPGAFAPLLESERLLTYGDPTKYYGASAAPYVDSAGNAMWSVNVVIGDDEGTFAGTRPLTRYA